MRIKRIYIESWRHFRGVLIEPPDSPVVCLVGSNGAGKSQILELIAACAARIGLSAGHEAARGDPFSDDARFEIDFVIDTNSVPVLEEHGSLIFPEEFRSEAEAWNRTLSLVSTGKNQFFVVAGGVVDAFSQNVAQIIVNAIGRSAAVHYLSLDADRAYPKITIHSSEVGGAFERDWGGSQRGSSFRPTRTLYEEWFKYLLGTENQENGKYIESLRLARISKKREPKFVDHFESYRESVRKVLPHLIFTGVDANKREIKFDSTGASLSFHQLSGGEREIAFLVGQIERFGLRRGLLLVDEPELHLNYDLLRAWVSYLKSTVEVGQIWLATHSLEVVEVAGQDSTFILNRNEGNRQVESVSKLADVPVVATLSRAVGSPAFSIQNLVFVYVEGEEEIGERERFRAISDLAANVRFLEGGSCNEVVRRLAGLKELSAVSGQNIRLGAIIDRDWRGSAEISRLEKDGVFVLGVHEVENMFICPAALSQLMSQLGKPPGQGENLVREVADKRAGAWIFDAARTDPSLRKFPEPLSSTRTLVHSLAWPDFEGLLEVQCERVAGSETQLQESQRDVLKRHLLARAKIYSRIRGEPDLWKKIEGKEALRSLVPLIGLANPETAERAVCEIWKNNPSLIPEELTQLRSYIAAL